MRRQASVAFVLLILSASTARAATLLVTNLNDVAAGSLRQAVQDAAPGDTIRFAPGLTGTITNLGAPYEVSRPLTIVGPGANVLAMHGNDAHALFLSQNGEFRISGLTLRDAYGSSGSAITSLDTLIVSRCTFRFNGGYEAGAIRASGGVLDVSECTFESNNSYLGYGGAIQTSANSTISASTFYANQGGALEASAKLVLVNCTFVSNYNGYGGALRLLGSPQTVVDCTITANQGDVYGGGVYAPGAAPQFMNTIIAGNFTNGSHPDFSGAVGSLGYNLVGNSEGSSGFGLAGSHDQIGYPGAPISPNLAALGDFGGPTYTMPPMPGSVAIDQGKSPYPNDQRGRGRFHDQPGVTNAGGGDGSDIGAYELRPTVRIVTTLADAGAGSLRQAIADMHPYDADSVKFASNVKGTITLTSGQLALAKSGVVVGPNAWNLAVHGNNAGRVFMISSGKSVEISGLTVTGGYASEGVAILTNGALTLRGCRFVGNNLLPGDFNFGGIIREAPPGALTMENCTVANNATGFGGGVYAGFGPPGGDLVSIANCTFSGNTGPGIVSSSSAATVRNCTITNNNSSGLGNGGGIYWLQGPPINVGSTILAGNAGPSDVNGAFTSAGWNLVGKSDGSSGFTHGVNHDLVGTAAAPLAANLKPLQSNGGPGETHALLFPSPVLDKGHAFRPLDQRGSARYNDPFVVNADDGSDIGAYEHNPSSPIGVDEAAVTAGIALAAPRPNPAPRGLTAFVSRLGSRAEVTIGVYDVAGRRVRELVSEARAPGEYVDSWDGRDGDGRQVRAGVYFARLVAGPRTATRNFVVLP